MLKPGAVIEPESEEVHIGLQTWRRVEAQSVMHTRQSTKCVAKLKALEDLTMSHCYCLLSLGRQQINPNEPLISPYLQN